MTGFGGPFNQGTSVSGLLGTPAGGTSVTGLLGTPVPPTSTGTTGLGPQGSSTTGTTDQGATAVGLGASTSTTSGGNVSIPTIGDPKTWIAGMVVLAGFVMLTNSNDDTKNLGRALIGLVAVTAVYKYGGNALVEVDALFGTSLSGGKVLFNPNGAA